MRMSPLRGRAVLALALAFAFAALAGAGCARREGSPEGAYRGFVRAMGDRDPDAAWALLSSDTQAWLDARARGAAERAPGVVSPSGRQLLVGDAALAAPKLASVKILRESADRAVLSVTDQAGASREVEVVLEGTWRVRIPEPAGR